VKEGVSAHPCVYSQCCVEILVVEIIVSVVQDIVHDFFSSKSSQHTRSPQRLGRSSSLDSQQKQTS
jgi:hypothetical protein